MLVKYEVIKIVHVKKYFVIETRVTLTDKPFLKYRSHCLLFEI